MVHTKSRSLAKLADSLVRSVMNQSSYRTYRSPSLSEEVKKAGDQQMSPELLNEVISMKFTQCIS